MNLREKQEQLKIELVAVTTTQRKKFIINYSFFILINFVKLDTVRKGERF